MKRLVLVVGWITIIAAVVGVVGYAAAYYLISQTPF